MRQRYPQYNWIASFVDVFIMLSISVSFITMSLALRHVLDGLAEAWRVSRRWSLQGRWPWRTIVLYGAHFGCVYIIAQLNPHGFLTVMEKITSLALNLEAGVFVCLMLSKARHQYGAVAIPYALPNWCARVRANARRLTACLATGCTTHILWSWATLCSRPFTTSCCCWTACFERKRRSCFCVSGVPRRGGCAAGRILHPLAMNEHTAGCARVADPLDDLLFGGHFDEPTRRTDENESENRENPNVKQSSRSGSSNANDKSSRDASSSPKSYSDEYQHLLANNVLVSDEILISGKVGVSLRTTADVAPTHQTKTKQLLHYIETRGGTEQAQDEEKSFLRAKIFKFRLTQLLR